MSFSDISEINNLAKEFEQAFSIEDKVKITTEAPISNVVELPGGFVLSNGTLATTAEVRELNGLDEEELAKATTANRMLHTAFSKGLVSIGGSEAYKENLNTLLSGDKEAILLGIRNVTFGSKIPYTYTCSSCLEEQDTEIDLLKDVEITKLNDPVSDRIFTVKLKNGEAVVTLPNGVTNKKLMDAEDKSTAELVTIILSGCLVSINGTPSLGVQTALNLGILDRETIISEIYRRTPGPRLGEVTKACKACGNETPLPLSLASLFRI